MELLARELNLTIPRALHYAATKSTHGGSTEDHIHKNLPYGLDGIFDPTANMTLDLRIGAQVQIIGQSQEDVRRWGNIGVIVKSLGGVDDEGHYSIRLGDEKTGILRVLGRWWLEDA